MDLSRGLGDVYKRQAYGYDEGTLTTSSAQAKYKIIGYITYTGRYIGNNLFRNSIVFSTIIIQLAIIVDALLISSIFTFIHLIIGRKKTAAKRNWLNCIIYFTGIMPF
jgi:hypothetical protein